MIKNDKMLENNDLYGEDTKELEKKIDSFEYKMKNETGEGTIIGYQIFPGIQIFYNDIHMSNSEDQNKLPYQDVMEINHCREGRFECEFQNGKVCYLGTGDLSVNMQTHKTRFAWFPLSHYQGISVVVNLDIASKTVNRISNVLGGIPIDLYAIKERLCGEEDTFIMRATNSIEHIFSELYTAQEDLNFGYLKIKVLELFLFLNRDNITAECTERQYFSRNKIIIMKEIESYLVRNLEQHITLNELSERYHISLTALKNCFKSVYGTSIFAYMRRYRLQQASLLIKETDLNITEVAGRVGYENASKFSEAFKKHFKLSPIEYRKHNV